MAQIHIKDRDGQDVIHEVAEATDIAKIAAIQELTFAIRILTVRMNNKKWQ
jgi:uncharacterized protein (DUF4213/DUF364 family)